MTSNQLRSKYLQFFADKNHVVIPSAPLVPQNDPTTLFTSSGMQPLINYLLGESHPQGKRLVDSQKSFRSQDIEEVGDNRHTTMFEMLGNWSLGDYFKKDQLTWFFTFLTDKKSGLGINPNKIYVTVFSGDHDAGIGRDDDSIAIWKELFQSVGIEAQYVELDTEEQGYQTGMSGGRIFGFGVKKNWWSRSGVPDQMPASEPGGPDSEVFFDSGLDHDIKYGKHCHPNCDCGRFFEIGNSVFMQYQKKVDGSLVELSQKNVDFGGGLERLLVAVHDDPDVFTTDLFSPIIKKLEEISGQTYADTDVTAAFRVISDHVKAAVMLACDGVYPGNKEQGYFSRRLLRRAIRFGIKLGLETNFIGGLVPVVGQIYNQAYPEVTASADKIAQIFDQEETKFRKTLGKGLKEFVKVVTDEMLTGQQAFFLYETYGFPLELSIEEATARGFKVSDQVETEFQSRRQAHSQSSRTASAGMFKGGLADHSQATTKLHTATHLLHAALRNQLGSDVHQEGSNITAERLRFDFAYAPALTLEQLTPVEAEINEQIKAELPVVKTMEDRDQAFKSGAMAFFREKYPDKVSVYTIGEAQNFYSKELCGGPHVTNTREIGEVKITKVQSIGANKKRIYAQVV